MDKFWYRNPSKLEVIGRCGEDEKTNDHAEPTKFHPHHQKKRQQFWKLLLIIFQRFPNSEESNLPKLPSNSTKQLNAQKK